MFKQNIENKLLIKMVVILPFVSALIYFASMYAVPIADIDIWWHLATGRYLLQTGTFLTSDPFSLGGTMISPGRELILNGYWLSQILFYSIYQLFGLVGIVVLRVVFLLIPSLSILAYGWRRDHLSPSLMFLVLLVGWAMVEVHGIRPNHLTVAIVPILLILLAEIGYASDQKQGGKYNLRVAWLLPLLMLVWANLHGGFLLGVAIILLYAASETVTLWWNNQPFNQLAKLWSIVALTVLVSFVNPNGILTYIQYFNFQGGVIQQKTAEYLSPLILAKDGTMIYWPYFIMLLMCLLLLVFRRFTFSVTRVLILLFLATISLTAFRYAPLFVGAAGVLLLPELQIIFESVHKRKWQSCLTNIGFVSAFVIIMVVWFPTKTGSLSKGIVDTTKFPIEAVEFIAEQKLSGVVFNHFNWGGYLIWKQSDILTTFIDGRSLNLPLFHAYTRALWLPEETQAILDRNSVDLIIMPRLNPFTNELYALTDYLWREREWELVYRDDIGMVFVRQGQFTDVARLNKALIYQDVLLDVESLSQSLGGSRYFDKIAAFARMRLTLTPQSP